MIINRIGRVRDKLSHEYGDCKDNYLTWGIDASGLANHVGGRIIKANVQIELANAERIFDQVSPFFLLEAKLGIPCIKRDRIAEMVIDPIQNRYHITDDRDVNDPYFTHAHFIANSEGFEINEL